MNLKKLAIRYRRGNSNNGYFAIISIIIVIIFLCVIANIYYFFFYDGEEEIIISGCRSFRAENYNPRATIDDGTCIFTRESSCNNNGEPDVNNNCGCDIGFGGRNCKKPPEDLYQNVIIESKKVYIDNTEYVVNTLRLILNHQNRILSNSMTINNLDLDKIMIDSELNEPLIMEEYNQIKYTIETLGVHLDDIVKNMLYKRLYNTHLSIGTYPVEIYPNGRPIWPYLDNIIWIKSDVFPVEGVPTAFFQLTLKSDTNTGDIIYEYGDSTKAEYINIKLNIVNGEIILE